MTFLGGTNFKPLTLSIALLFAAWSALALAHDKKDRDRFDRAFQYGQEQGYEDGFRHGREDNGRGLDYDLKSDDYKKADRGYRKEYGSKGDYKKGYKQAYQQGYDEGYGRGWSRRQSRYPDRDRRDSRDWPGRGDRMTRVYDFGYEQGERDGFKKGQEDLDRDRDFDPQRHKDYRNADRGYERDLGSKHEYQGGYRDGFLRGYEDGYGSYGRHSRSNNQRGRGWEDIFGGIVGRRP